MTEARWAQVKALFQATIERPAPERAAFLAAAAGADQALRREVESLLRSDNPDDDLTKLLQQPDRDPSDATPDETRTQPQSPFHTFGPYRIVGLLGAGGMGEVHRARDSKLNRDVALKMLPRALELDPDRVARFRREARALAALNHPHIAAIYGLEESHGRQALVLELVEGTTLAERIAGRPLPGKEALELARQIAGALEAAHEKGIVHRDLKPANVKVTPSGVVKVLDFGLAKTAAVEQTVAEVTQTSSGDGRTRVGAVLGTAAYMSPEQARGREVDARTDVWAFGCVLFEMLSGRKAFGADADSDSTEKVLARDPDWTALPRVTPPQVRALLRRCLEKDPDKRLRTVAEARQVIERLLSRGRFGAPARLVAAGLAAALVVAAVTIYAWSRRGPTPGMTEWVQLTNLDSVTQPALSPDGRMLAFIRGPSTFVTTGQLYLKQLPAGDAVPLTQDALPKMAPVFSPDGSRIAYTVNDGSSWDTWEVPTLRGSPRQWLKNASGLAWVDPEHLVFSEVKAGQHMAIVRSAAPPDRRHDVYIPAHHSAMAHRSSPSPDRTSVLVVEMDARGAWIPCRLAPLAGGPSRQVGPPGRCTAAAWSPDGRWMYFTANAGDGFHVWRQRFPAGTPEQVTFGPTEEEGLAIAPDGRSLITSVGLIRRSVWVRDGSGERQISLEGYAFWPLMSADGQRVCFRVTRSAGTGQTPSELWVADLRSGTTQRLFPGKLVTGYDLSRDGRVVAAVQDADGRLRLWLGPIDGAEAPQPIPGADGDNPRFAGHGEILFRVLDGNSAWLYRISRDGSRRVQVARATGTVLGGPSPDGAWVSNISTGAGKMSLYSMRGGPPLPILPYSQTTRMRWSPDGRHAYISVQFGQASAFAEGRTYVLPVPDGSVLPDLPPGGFQTEEELAAMPGVTVIPHGDVGLGNSPSIHAYSRVTATRNLYRIPLP